MSQSTALARTNTKGGFLKSRALWAIALFAVTCQLMAAAKLGAISPIDCAYPTWTSWAIQEYVKKPDKTDIVFLGSSLMLVPLDGADADSLKKPIDGAKHHKSILFESRFQNYSGSTISTYNFALPGEVPSDAYLITKHLLKGEKCPEVIVYGVGPRDFMDNLLPSPSATDPYRHLSRLGDFKERVNLMVPSWEARLGYELAQICYPLKHSEDIITTVSRYAGKLVASTFADIKPSDIHKRRQLIPDYHPWEIGLNECFFKPTTDETRGGFLDNIEEYRKRYKKLNWDTFHAQMQFLSDIMDISNERGIHMVLVAMPITDINRQLIADPAWQKYKEGLEQLAESKGATYFDMYDSKTFPQKDFGDTVHLHSGGGAKFLDLLAKKLACDHTVISALHINRQDDEHQAIAGLRKTGL